MAQSKMRRRKFLASVAAVPAVALLPDVAMAEPTKLASFSEPLRLVPGSTITLRFDGIQRWFRVENLGDYPAIITNAVQKTDELYRILPDPPSPSL